MVATQILDNRRPFEATDPGADGVQTPDRLLTVETDRLRERATRLFFRRSPTGGGSAAQGLDHGTIQVANYDLCHVGMIE